jgi:hypothetical protein
MAKKKAVAKKAPAAKKAPTAKKPENQPEKKPAIFRGEEEEGYSLDELETKAFDLAQSSEPVREALENEVTDAIGKAVRKVFKVHGLALSPAQAANMAMILFGD